MLLKAASCKGSDYLKDVDVVIRADRSATYVLHKYENIFYSMDFPYCQIPLMKEVDKMDLYIPTS